MKDNSITVAGKRWVPIFCIFPRKCHLSDKRIRWFSQAYKCTKINNPRPSPTRHQSGNSFNLIFESYWARPEAITFAKLKEKKNSDDSDTAPCCSGPGPTII